MNVLSYILKYKNQLSLEKHLNHENRSQKPITFISENSRETENEM